jgi:hypothetical protein
MVVTVGRSQEKRFGALFTCLSTRAVNMEMGHSLDTESAIRAIRRFVARRGIPEKIFLDNGTNFHIAERELRESLEQFNQQQITQELAVKARGLSGSSPHMKVRIRGEFGRG